MITATQFLGRNIYRCRNKFGMTVIEQVSFLYGKAFYAYNRLGIVGAAQPFRTRSAASSEEWSDSGTPESPTCRKAGNRQKATPPTTAGGFSATQILTMHLTFF